MEAFQNPDFQTIKLYLKEYLRQNSDFTDFDFEGSNLSVLMDLLSYNAHQQQIYNSAALGESSLDSATKRANVVAHAKVLGYIPKSRKAPRALVDITVSMPNTYMYNSFTLNRGDSFTSTIDGQSFTFRVTQDYIANSSNRIFFIPNVEIVQGIYRSISYKANSQPTQRYVIPSKNIDTDELIVRIQPSANISTFEEFYPTTDLTRLRSDSRNFFIQENHMGFYEIYFGDGVLGKAILPQNIIHISYLITDGYESNGAKVFLPGKIENLLDGSIQVKTIQSAQGGADREDLKSIKFYAPRSYASQGIAITNDGYITQIMKLIPGVESVNVWGGDEDPSKQYGTVFISIKSTGDAVYNAAYKGFIIEKLRQVSVVNTDFQIIDPNFVYLSISSLVRLDREFPIIESEIRNAVENAIENFSNENLSKFGRNFYLTRLTAEIDDSHKSILSNQTQFFVQKRVYWDTLELKQSKIVDVNFGFSLKPNSIVSSLFYSNPEYYPEFAGKLTIEQDEFTIFDDGLGKLFIKSNFNPNITLEIGEVEYSTGSIYIGDLIVDQLPMYDSISINAFPMDEDIIVSRNTILLNEKRSSNSGSFIDPGVKVEFI